MTDYPATWLADVLRAGGCRVVEESGWKTRGRPASSGTFRPRALVRHWDASGSGSHNVAVLINGNANAPGPLCSIWTCNGGAGHEASVHVIAAGRTNHGGTGQAWGTIPEDDANTYAVGHEIRQTVDQPWPAAQLEQVRLAEGAILKHLSAVAANALCSHSEYAPDRKIDTTEGAHGQDMSAERSAVQRVIDDGGVADLRLNYVSVSTDKDLDVGTSAQRVKFDHETSDKAGVHDAGAGAIRAPWPCVMQGVVEISTNDPCRVTVQRAESSGEALATESVTDVPEGRSSVPFVASWSEGQLLYVVLSTVAGGAEVGYVGVQVTQIERA